MLGAQHEGDDVLDVERHIRDSNSIFRVRFPQKRVEVAIIVFAQFAVESTSLHLTQPSRPHIKNDVVDFLLVRHVTLLWEYKPIVSFLLRRLRVPRRHDSRLLLVRDEARVVQVVVLVTSLGKQEEIEHDALSDAGEGVLR